MRFQVVAVVPNCVPAQGKVYAPRDSVSSFTHRDIEFFRDLPALHPVTVPFNMPIYSNPAFQILVYALEGMTNKTFSEVFETSIVRPLHLNATYLSTPPITDDLNAIIPGDKIESAWKIDVGDETSSA